MICATGGGNIIIIAIVAVIISVVIVIVIREHFEKCVDAWQSFYNSKEPHRDRLPDPWNSSLNDFQRMIVLRCIRPDKARTFLQYSQ